MTAVQHAAASTGFPLESLELEITETAMMSDGPAMNEVLEHIQHLGVGIALDDFGTGFSSLALVQKLPVTTIKIDRSFTQHITDRHEDLAIATSVIDLARAVGLRTIAEGVETREQLSLLHRLGCTAGQGYLWSRALSPEGLAERLSCGPVGLAHVRKESRWRSHHLYGAARSRHKVARNA